MINTIILNDYIMKGKHQNSTFRLKLKYALYSFDCWSKENILSDVPTQK